jgi:hypothetical protein
MQRKSERLFRIYQRLKSSPQTIDELYLWSKKADLGIGRRTLYRYLEELEDTIHDPGFELVSSNHNSKEKRWQVVSTQRMHHEQHREAMRRFYLLTQLAGKHLQSLTTGYLEILEGELNRHVSVDHKIRSLREQLIITGWSEANYSEKDIETLLKLMRAIENKELVTLELFPILSAEQPVKGIFDWAIHYIISHRGTIYVAAIRKGQKRFHFIEVESINQISFANIRFRKHPERKEVEEELSRRFGITNGDGPTYKISILFSGALPISKGDVKHPFLEKRSWHANQRFIHDENGNLILQFQSQLNRELLGWIFMWMDQLKVLGPPQLVTLIGKKLNDMQAVINGREPGNGDIR